VIDITKTTEPKSDQQNFDDYAGGPKTVTVTEVKAGSAEQPVEIHLAEFPGRPYKPSKSMRRVLVACWGPDAEVYAGRRMTLFGDPTVKFGKDTVGGIRIAALSHLEKPVTVSLTVTRGRRAPFTVQVLTENDNFLDAINAATTLEELKAAWTAADKAGHGKRLTAATNARKAELTAVVVDEADPRYVAAEGD
jgi:hypothetical protein